MAGIAAWTVDFHVHCLEHDRHPDPGDCQTGDEPDFL
jgi:hypothetical protein